MQRQRRKFISRTLLNLTVVFFMIVWSIPTLGLLITSFRPYVDIVRTGWWTTFWHLAEWTRFTLGNYAQIINQQGFGKAFLNSLEITIPAIFISLIVAAVAAYAFAWMKFRGRQALLMVAITLLVIPGQMTFIPLLKLYNTLGLSGTFPGVWLAHTAYGLPFLLFLLRNFFGALPKELFDAAFIDGASHWTAFWRIALPLSLPALASVAIFQALWIWNDFLVALIFLGTSPDVAPLTVKIASLVGAYGQDWQLLTAGAFISMVLPLIIFFSLQRYFVRGILAGSLKG